LGRGQGREGGGEEEEGYGGAVCAVDRCTEMMERGDENGLSVMQV
jgi:hypothetical protein